MGLHMALPCTVFDIIISKNTAALKSGQGSLTSSDWYHIR